MFHNGRFTGILASFFVLTFALPPRPKKTTGKRHRATKPLLFASRASDLAKENLERVRLLRPAQKKYW